MTIDKASAYRNEVISLLKTTTAAVYFSKKGYKVTSCDNVPADLQRSSQFKYSCPQSATVMQEHLAL